MTRVRIEWDERKNVSNQRKHRVSFEEASEIFHDPLHVSVQDRVEEEEERWQTIGFVNGILLLMVAHTVQEKSAAQDIIRIISARRATLKERQRYENENG